MNMEMYSSLNWNIKEARPNRIKTYALFKQVTDFPKNSDDVVISANNTNEVAISVHEQSNCKVFAFDKVFCSDVSQMELYDSILKSAVKDVMVGLNCFLVVFRLPTPINVKPIAIASCAMEMDLIKSIVANAMKDLLSIVKNEETIDSSLHASYFEVHGDKVIDLLSNCSESKDLSILKTVDQQDFIEIKDLTEKPLVDEADISKLLSNVSPCGLKVFSGCYHSIFSSTYVKKSIQSDGLGFMKTGKLTVVDFAECTNNILLEETVKSFSAGSIPGKCEFQPFSCQSKLAEFVKPAFGGNAKTSIVVTLSSVLDSQEKDLRTLQFVSQAQKILNYPEINEKLIIPVSLKEYSEEIQELQNDHSAIKNCSGMKLDNLMYRSYKVSLAVENEKLKTLDKHLSSLAESVDAKKQSAISRQSSIDLIESELKEEEEISENLRLEIEKLKNGSRTKQRLSSKAGEILAIKDKRRDCQIEKKKIMSELSKAKRNYSESVLNIQTLRKSLVSLSNDADFEQITLKSNLKLLASQMSNVALHFSTLQKDLFKKLKELSNFDIVLKTWHQNTEDLQSKFSSFVEKHTRNFNMMSQQIAPSFSLHKYQDDILNIIRKNKNEGGSVLSYYYHKIQSFSDSSLKVLREIANQLEMIQNIYETEVNAIATALSSLSQGFKQFVSSINLSMKSFQQYFEEQERKLMLFTDMTCYQDEFKKRFDDNIGSIKSALSNLKEMCSSHTDSTFSKWTEIQKDFVKSTEKYGNVDKLMENSLLRIYKEMSKYCENLAELQSNSAENSTLKDKTENVENRLNQLLQMHEENIIVTKDAAIASEKITEKEVMEVNKYITSEKLEVDKEFKNLSLKLQMSSRSFNEELRNIQIGFSCNWENLKKNFDVLFSTFPHLVTIYNSYVSNSDGVLTKTGEIPKILPKTCITSYDILPQLEISFDESHFSTYFTSTPCKQVSRSPVYNKTEKRMRTLSAEKAKLLQRVKSVVHQQMSEKQMCEKSDSSDSESERKSKKSHNISTMSLPNLNSNAMMNLGARKKTFPKCRTQKK